MKSQIYRNYHYNKTRKRWVVSKTVNGVHRHFGQFRTEEQAKRAVELFEEKGWNHEIRWKIRDQVLDELGV